MATFIIGILFFLGVHSVSIINEPWRDRVVDTIGEWPWKALYSLAAVAGLLLLIYGYGSIRYDAAVIYDPPGWLKHVSILVLVPVFPLLLAAYLPGRIKSKTRHPMLLAVKIWALAHLLANGSVADVLLFGSFLGWAVWDRISLKDRQERAILGAPPAGVNDIIAIAGGLGIYLGFIFWFHELFFGVSVY
jgi:uncharacterized membrane protein